MLVDDHRSRIDVLGAIGNSSALDLFVVTTPSALYLFRLSLGACNGVTQILRRLSRSGNDRS
jgi:hypothetical protein